MAAVAGDISYEEHARQLQAWGRRLLPLEVEARPKKGIELERLLHERVCLFEAFADFNLWQVIEPRLVEVQRHLIERLRSPEDIWMLSDSQFEECIAELLDRIGYHVLWVPGGKDGGEDIVAANGECRYLIDVKR